MFIGKTTIVCAFRAAAVDDAPAGGQARNSELASARGGRFSRG